MATRKYNYDLNKIKEIFKKNKGPEAHQELAKHIKAAHPGKNNEELIGLGIKSALRAAHVRGWIKKSHNSNVTTSAWPEEKKALLRKLKEERKTAKEIALHPEFVDDFKRYPGYPSHTLGNFMKVVGYDREKLKASKRTGTSKEAEVKDSKELRILIPHITSARFLTVKTARKWFDKLGRRASLHEILTAFVKEGELVRIPGSDPNKDIYFSARPDFYESRELYELFTKLGLEAEIERIFRHIETAAKNGISLGRLKTELYGEAKTQEFLKTFLRFYVERGLLETHGSRYQPSEIAAISGFDPQTIKTLELLEEAAVRAEKPKQLPSSMQEVQKLIEQGRAKRTVPPMKLERSDKSKKIKIALVAEPMYGNQFTDAELLNQYLHRAREHSLHFDMCYATGLVAGTFTGTQQIRRQYTILEEMNAAEVQYRSAELTIQDLEKLSDKIFIELGDDDMQFARDYAEMQQAIEGKVWRFGAKASWSAEAARRRWQREFLDKWKIQSRIIAPYKYRIGRSLLNADEVFERIGRRKTEYWLIVEILAATKHGSPYPEDYKKIVDIEALFGNKGSQRVVTPDTIRLDIGNGREIWFDHGSGHFSSVTQYQSVVHRPEQIMRILAASGRKTPMMFVGAHQETFWATRTPGPNGIWIMQLPGLQDTSMSAERNLQKIHDYIPTAKHWRQHGFRGIPPTPAICDMEILDDGRIRFRLWNRRIAKVIEENKDKPEETATVISLNDLQIGSPTAWPEMAIRALDYALYECMADTIIANGDIIHGHNYPGFAKESNTIALVGLGQQKDFTLKILTPLLLNAPRLQAMYAIDGNHEWNTFGERVAGAHHVNFLTHYLTGYIEGAHRVGQDIPLKIARTEYRTRWPRSGNPEPDKVYAAFHLNRYAGFTVVASHLFNLKSQTRSGNSSPIFQMMNHLAGFASAADIIDLYIGAHYHSPHMAQIAEKLLVHVPACAGQSGFEWHLGLKAQVGFMLFRFSNRLGIEVEFIPWQFLHNHYKLKSPEYRGKEELLCRPKRGTREYRYSKQSPLIEEATDQVNRYVEIDEDLYTVPEE